jgi:hypothetical protein
MPVLLKQSSFRILIVILFLLGFAHYSFATTVIVPSDDEMIIGARSIVRGRVTAIESTFDSDRVRIYTYITIVVDEVIKGELTERRIVLKEMGGEVGDEGFKVFGNPQFTTGENVLLYLDTWRDGSLRTHQLFLGKFSITDDPSTGQQVVVRSLTDDGVSVLPPHAEHIRSERTITDRMELSAYIAMLRHRLEVNRDLSREFQDRYYRDIPVHAVPKEYNEVAARGDIHPNWTFISTAHPRWFQPDSGQPVIFNINPAGAPSAQSVDDMVAAMNAWSTISGCALRIQSGGTTSVCNESSSFNLILFNACDGRWSPSPGCAGTLALGGLGWTGNTRVINGTTFREARSGFVSFNPNASCHFTLSCNVREVAVHELGHAVGLGHSANTDATMAAFAHFDGRCASLRQDDRDGAIFIYPGTGGGPGPLDITTTSLPGGTVGTAYSQTLSATGGTAPYSWSLVAGQGTLPPPLTLNPSTGVISGTPNTAGTYNFTMRVNDSASGSDQQALSIVVAAQGAGPYSSQFVSQQGVPSSIAPGASFQVTMRWTNNGTQTWSGSAFYIVTQNPSFNTNWLGGTFNAISLNGFSIATGQQLDVTFNAIAPSVSGSYNFQWQVYQNGGVGFFGQASTNVVINVGTSCSAVPATASQSFAANGGAGSFNVNASAGCNWTAVSNNAFITITSGSGTGNGTVSYTVAAHSSTSARSGSISIGAQTFNVLQGGAFLDVPIGHAFYTDIGKLSARGVTTGCGGGNYCPDQLVTREQMAAFIIRALGEFSPPPPSSQRFADVSPTNPFYAFIEQMAVRQITQGCGGGNYCPSSTVTREQMAAFLIRARGEFTPPTPSSQRFGDVPPANPFYNFIDRMAALGITLGCSAEPPMYCPAQTVTRAQMAAFLVRAFGL